MKALVCNKCGVVETSEEDMDRMVALILQNDSAGLFGEMHLCSDCLDLFWTWMSCRDKAKVE